MNISGISVVGTKGMSVGTKAGELIVGSSIVDRRSEERRVGKECQ